MVATGGDGSVNDKRKGLLKALLNARWWTGVAGIVAVIALIGQIFGWSWLSGDPTREQQIDALKVGIQLRLAPVEQLLPEVIEAGRMNEDRRYRISNSFTGRMEQPVDEFGEIGVPGLLSQYSAITGDQDAANVAKEYLSLMVPLESERLYSRGVVGDGGANLTSEGRELLNRLGVLVAKAKQIAAD